MEYEDAQRTWQKYYQRKKVERVEEATVIWERVRQIDGVESVDFTLDFLMFGASKETVDPLATQLSESYAVDVSQDSASAYWFVRATTKPYAIKLIDGQLIAWAEFIADVAQSHGCVFSTWKLEAPALSLSLSNEDIESSS